MSLLKGSGTGHSFHPQASEPASDNTLVGFLSEAGTQPGKLEACSLSVPTGYMAEGWIHLWLCDCSMRKQRFLVIIRQLLTLQK